MNISIIGLLFLLAWASAGHPGARTKGCTWVDSEGDLWLFGGVNYQSIASYRGGHLNDLWKYDTKALEWKWIQGNNDPNFSGIFGTKGVFNATNNPPSLIHPLCFQTQTEFRIVLGFGPAPFPSTGGLMDQWSYSLKKNQWAWTFGDQQVESPGVYDNRGFFNTMSLPRARAASYIWHGHDNSIYVYGGILKEFGVVGDFWKFDLDLNMYAWLRGSPASNVPSIPGTRGVSSATNYPGSRYAGVNWVGPDGTLWMLGGYGVDQNGNIGVLNDVWRYIPLLNEWTWIGGSPAAGAWGNYGQLNQASPSTVMGARLAGGSWYDAKNDLVYIFGGLGVNDAGAFGFLNDFWTYKPSTNEFTWIGGTPAINNRANFGTYRVPTPGAIPTSSFYYYTWITNDTLWLYGGNWQDTPYEFFTALWSYDTSSRLWTWVDGFQESNVPVQYPVISPLADEPASPPLNGEPSSEPGTTPLSPNNVSFTPWQIIRDNIDLTYRRKILGWGILVVVGLDAGLLMLLACCNKVHVPTKE